MSHFYTLKCDGGAQPNPGKGASASVIYNSKGEIIDKAAVYHTHTTNNIAEYKSLILGLERAIKLNIKKLNIRMDSQLVVKQIKMEYKINNSTLKELHVEIMNLLLHFDEFTIEHIYRDKNKDADELADLCIMLKQNI